ncbi:transmembrane protein 229B isoform X1 [Vidua macroura]|uniref:transmembrane protein 229B isoform X1 n=1 Tax=Vidua macroura TaxID=187451 RepID=UPI0023A7E603|nr:transmembrane protein 229B isoform X1 [Vidua macroura]
MKDSYCRLTSQGALCHIVFPAGANTPGVWAGQGAPDAHLSTHRPAAAGSGSPGGAGPSLGAPPPRSGSVPRHGPGRARRTGPPACGPREAAAGRREDAGPAPRGGGGSARQCEVVRKELREGGGAGWLSGASMCRLKPHPYYGRLSLAHFTSRRPRGTHGHRKAVWLLC